MAKSRFDKLKALKLHTLGGKEALIRPALIASMTAGKPETRIHCIDGSTTLVRESPEQISAMIAAGGSSMLPGSAAYAKLKAHIEEDELSQFIHGDDSKELWIEALRQAAEKPQSKLAMLLSIYGEMLSPFAFFKSLSGASKRPSPLEAALNAKGFQRCERRQG